ncbi:hypothetical protein [Thomasclavelia sp.]
MGHFGFSYIGLIFLFMLFIPNIIWTRKMPEGYTAEKENKVLGLFERIGEILVCCCSLAFSDFNFYGFTAWTWWLMMAIAFMILYEIWWLRYFRSERKLKDFYTSIMYIPLAGATLPVIAFFLLGIYGKVVWMLISVLILGIGHIGIHMEHYNKLNKSIR